MLYGIRKVRWTVSRSMKTHRCSTSAFATLALLIYAATASPNASNPILSTVLRIIHDLRHLLCWILMIHRSLRLSLSFSKELRSTLPCLLLPPSWPGTQLLSLLQRRLQVLRSQEHRLMSVLLLYPGPAWVDQYSTRQLRQRFRALGWALSLDLWNWKSK